MIEWVFFDVGETLVDETRVWASWAEWLRVPPLTLYAALGAVVARGEHHRRAFELVRPGIDLAAEVAARARAGVTDAYEPRDLYPDALPCLRAMRDMGLRVALAGNHGSLAIVERLELPADFVTTASQLGVEKPSCEFFRRLARAAGAPPDRCVSIGDRIDNDILPARELAMRTVFVRRGPWGLVHGLRDDASVADLTVRNLAEFAAAPPTWLRSSPRDL